MLLFFLYLYSDRLWVCCCLDEVNKLVLPLVYGRRQSARSPRVKVLFCPCNSAFPRLRFYMYINLLDNLLCISVLVLF